MDNIFNLYDHKDMKGFKGQFLKEWAKEIDREATTLKTWFHYDRIPDTITETQLEWGRNWLRNRIALNQDVKGNIKI